MWVDAMGRRADLHPPDDSRMEVGLPMNRMKVAELTSGVGALVLGIGLGALFAPWVHPAAIGVTTVGLVTHAFGMWDKHRLDGQTSESDFAWTTLFYWICWVGLVGIVLWLIVAAL